MHRIARVEEAPVVFEIAERQQHLRDIEAEFVPHLLVGVEQQGHAAGGRRLLVGNSCAFGRFTDDAQAQRDRARRTQDDVRPFGAKLGNILEQALEEAIARREEFKVGKEGRTDFDDNVSLFGHAFQKLRRLEISRA